MTLSIQVPHSCQDITRVSEAMSRNEGQPCREQIIACVVNPVPRPAKDTWKRRYHPFPWTSLGTIPSYLIPAMELR